MKIGDLVRWVLEERELGIIVDIQQSQQIGALLTDYRVFCLSDGNYYHAYDREIEVINESR